MQPYWRFQAEWPSCTCAWAHLATSWRARKTPEFEGAKPSPLHSHTPQRWRSLKHPSLAADMSKFATLDSLKGKPEGDDDKDKKKPSGNSLYVGGASSKGGRCVQSACAKGRA
jgi:hypothetical protein